MKYDSSGWHHPCFLAVSRVGKFATRWLPFSRRICSSTLPCCQWVNEHYHNPQRQREERYTIGRVQFRCSSLFVTFHARARYDSAVESLLPFRGQRVVTDDQCRHSRISVKKEHIVRFRGSTDGRSLYTLLCCLWFENNGELTVKAAHFVSCIFY